MRDLSWYVRELATLAAIAAFCVAMVEVADRLQPGSFPS